MTRDEISKASTAKLRTRRALLNLRRQLSPFADLSAIDNELDELYFELCSREPLVAADFLPDESQPAPTLSDERAYD
jgi:hypothetical protein